MTEFRSLFPALSSGVHLDNAAMAAVPQAVLDAVSDFESSRANVRRGLYPAAERADAAYDGARAEVARWLSAAVDEVVFTAGCTASLNMAAAMLGPMLKPGDLVAVSRAEHHSACLPWLNKVRRKKLRLHWLPVENGRVVPDVPREARVVVATHASNVTGAVTDLAALRQRAPGAILVVDGAQGLPHGPVDPRALGADFYAVSGHKAYGPTGVGVLWGRRELLETLPPAMLGGGMVGRVDEHGFTAQKPPHRFEAGTPPVAQAVGLGAAARLMLAQDWPSLRTHERALTERLTEGLARLGCCVLGPADLPVVSFTMPGCHPHDVAQLLAEDGIAVRAGHHCAQPLMAALGVEACVRASLAPYSTGDEVDALLDALPRVRRALA